MLELSFISVPLGNFAISVKRLPFTAKPNSTTIIIAVTRYQILNPIFLIKHLFS